VMTPGGISTTRIPERGELVVGRSDECALTLEDGKLSRRHGVFRCRGSGASRTVEYVDLGSLNGSFVGDRRLDPSEPVVLTDGDAVKIGQTVLVLQGAPREQRPRHLWSHSYFEARLEEECVRARGPFALLRVRATFAAEELEAEVPLLEEGPFA